MQGKAPPRRRPKNLAGYLEALSRPVFQAGISWRVIDSKWDGIRDAFASFDPRVVAEYDEDDINRLLADSRVVRSKAKIEATIDNAQALIELTAEHGSFRRYLKSHSSFEDAVADLKRQFRFIGDTGAYQFLWSVDEPTPERDEWVASQQARGPRRSRRPAAARRAAGSAT
jgi:3-methyladenine DNA glycosylase Tag